VKRVRRAAGGRGNQAHGSNECRTGGNTGRTQRTRRWSKALKSADQCVRCMKPRRRLWRKRARGTDPERHSGVSARAMVLSSLERNPGLGRELQRLAMQSSECIAGHAPEFQPRVRGLRNENDTFRICSERTAPPDDVYPTNPCGCRIDRREESGPRR
jgi:hypothetical protein